MSRVVFFESLKLNIVMAKMSSSKFEIEKFSGKNNFELWKLKMRDLLVQQGYRRPQMEKGKDP